MQFDAMHSGAVGQSVNQYLRVPGDQQTTLEDPLDAQFDHDDWLQLLLDGRNSVAGEHNKESLIQTLTLAADIHLMTSGDIQPSSADVDSRCDELYQTI